MQPVLDPQPFYATKLPVIASDYGIGRCNAMGGDEEVVRADRRALSFELDPNSAIVHRYVGWQVEHGQGAQDRFYLLPKPVGVALGQTILDFAGHDRIDTAFIGRQG